MSLPECEGLYDQKNILLRESIRDQKAGRKGEGSEKNEVTGERGKTLKAARPTSSLSHFITSICFIQL